MAKRASKIFSKTKNDNETRLIEQKLKAAEEKYHNLIASAYDGIMLIRHDGTIEFANQQLEKMFGYVPDELLNKQFEILIPERDRQKHHHYQEQYMLKPVQREMSRGLNTNGRRKDGSEIAVSISLSPYKSNSHLMVNCTVRDITEQKKLDETSRKLLKQEQILRDEAVNTNRIKDEFLATLSHELRTPLTAILGWAKELRSATADPKTIAEGLAVIERSALPQRQLINDLLDVSMIQSATLSLDMQDIDLAKVLNLAIDSVRQLAEKKSINIEIAIDSPIFMIFADAFRMQQVFWNLLINAVKFTPEHGKISVALKVNDTPTANGHRLKLTIPDRVSNQNFLNKFSNDSVRPTALQPESMAEWAWVWQLRAA